VQRQLRYSDPPKPLHLGGSQGYPPQIQDRARSPIEPALAGDPKPLIYFEQVAQDALDFKQVTYLQQLRLF
jgi:hypothetical protein